MLDGDLQQDIGLDGRDSVERDKIFAQTHANTLTEAGCGKPGSLHWAARLQKGVGHFQGLKSLTVVESGMIKLSSLKPRMNGLLVAVSTTWRASRAAFTLP